MLRARQKLLSPSAEVFKELCKLGHILFSGTLYRLRSVLLRLGILRLNGLRVLCLAVLGLRLLLGRSLLELGIILRLSILTLCGLSILLLRILGLSSLAVLRLSGLLGLKKIRSCRLCGSGLLRLLGRLLTTALLIVRFGNRKARTAVSGLGIIAAVSALGIVLALAAVESGEARCNDGNFHFVLNVGVYSCAEDYVCGGINHALYKFGRIVYLVKGEVLAADHVEYDAARAFDGGFKQRAIYGYAHRLYYSVFALGYAYAEVGYALVLENGFNIRKVEVYERGVYNEFGNALYALL